MAARKKRKRGRKIARRVGPTKVLALLSRSAKLIENAAKPIETEVNQGALKRALRKRHGKDKHFAFES